MNTTSAAGKTKHAGYQVGARRTVDSAPDVCWRFLTSSQGVAIWLGHVELASWQVGTKYAAADGVRGEVRVFKPYSHLRITWHPVGWQRASTMQLRIIPKGSGCTIALHQEHLPGPDARAMRKQDFITMLDGIEQALARSGTR